MTVRFDHALPTEPGTFAYTAGSIEVSGDQGSVLIQSLSLRLVTPQRVFLLSEFRFTDAASNGDLSATLELRRNDSNVGTIQLVDGRAPAVVLERGWHTRLWGESSGSGVEHYDLLLLVEGGLATDSITVAERKLEWIPTP